MAINCAISSPWRTPDHDPQDALGQGGNELRLDFTAEHAQQGKNHAHSAEAEGHWESTEQSENQRQEHAWSEYS